MSKKHEKFFFNTNIFDEDHIEEEDLEEEIPPPPSFSEEELAAARKLAFDEGKKSGIAEAKKSQSELVAHALDNVAKTMSVLIAAEEERSSIFEYESLQLTRSIFAKLFPHLNEKHGFEELMEKLKEILQAQHGQVEIKIYVAPEAVDGTQKMLSELSSRNLNAQFIVSGDEALSGDACKLSWADGGAIIDREETAEKIRNIIEQGLAGAPSKGHDEDTETIQDTKNPENSETKDNTLAEKNDTIEAGDVEKPDE